MSIIRKMAVPRPGMYVLDEDISLDSTMKRAVRADDPSARFVLGGAGSEVAADLVSGLSNVDVKDQRVSVASAMTIESTDPETTGPVPSRSEGESPGEVVVSTEDSTTTEGEPISTAALDADTDEPPAEKHKKAGGK